VTTEERSLAKAIGFGILFGMGARGLRSYAMSSYGVSISEGEAERIRERFFETYPDVRRWQLEQVEEAQRTGCSSTPMGRVRNFTREDKDDFHTAAMNTPIQGAEGEVMLAALAHLSEALPPLDALLVNCVHDELLVECPEENAGRVEAALRGCMERGMNDVFPNATLKGLVEVGYGPSWGAAK
jgi:DNA polymerase-1